MLDTLDEYMEELNLMKKQYGQEEELYPLINIMLRKWGNLEGCSIRAVDNGKYAQKDKKRKELPGRAYLGKYCAFPDIAILDKKFDAAKRVLEEDEKVKYEKENGKYENPLDYIYGCVEAKKFWEKLLEIREGENLKLKIEDVDIICLVPHSNSAKYHYEFVMKEENGDVKTKECEDFYDKKCKHYVSLSNKETLKNLVSESTKAELKRHDARVKNVKELNEIIDGNDFLVKRNKGIKVKICDTYLSNIPNVDAVTELIGELLWYGKVLYTNGIEWKEISISKENINEVINQRNEIVKEVESKIERIKKKKLSNEKEKIQEIYKAINLLDIFKNMTIYINCTNIATLFSYDEKNGFHKFKKDKHKGETDQKSSEIEWDNLISHLKKMSWKPTTQETESKNNIESTEATNPDVNNEKA